MYKTLKEIPNPYQPHNTIRNEKIFVGRKKEMNLILVSVEDFIKTGIKKDFLVYGDKSLGKTSFLNVLRNKLSQKGFLAVNFVVNNNKMSSSLNFFKELVDVLLDVGTPNDLLNRKEDTLDFTQKEIWEALTNVGTHDSKTFERQINLALQYAYALKNNRFDIPVSESNLIKDFKLISKDAKICYKGLILIIDEFQMLSENDSIIQLIQRMMEEIEDIIFILCGNQLLRSESFEKIQRKSELIELLPFGKNDVYDFLYKPLMNEGFTREEINECLDFDSLGFLFKKREHNPYHLNLILYHMFDKYKNYGRTKLGLDEDISSEILNKLKIHAVYHERISAQLNASSHEQRQALKRLFPYQNLNLNDIVQISLNFDEITDDSYNNRIKEIISDINLVASLNLFELTLPNNISMLTLLEISNISKNIAAEVKYKFIGDNIDELYLYHLINSSLGEELEITSHQDAIEFLSFNFFVYLIDKTVTMLKLEDDNNRIEAHSSVRIVERAEENEITSKVISDKLQLLAEKANKSEISSDDYNQVKNALENTSLQNLPIINNIFRYSANFYYVFVKVKIRHKIVLYEFYLPSDKEIEQNYVLYPADSLNTTSLQDYNVQVLDSVVLSIHPKMILFLQSIDSSELNVRLLRYIYRCDFERAINITDILKHFIYDENVGNNNLGFLYMCKGDLELSKKYFENVKNKEYITLCDLAYLSYLEKNLKQSEQYLKRALKSLKTLSPSEPTFSVIHQMLVSIDKRINLPSYFDIAFEPSAELIIEGNKAIIASFSKQNYGIGNIKKAKVISEIDKFYLCRFEYFIHFNCGEIDQARQKLQKVKDNLPESSYKEHFIELIKIDESIINK